MPSVRVKRHQYSTLPDRPRTAGANEPQSLASLFRQPSTQELSPANQPQSAPVPPPPRLNELPLRASRLRSNSVVYDLCTRGSLRAPLIPRLPRTDSNPNSQHSNSGVVTLEGPNTNVQIAGDDGAPGRIGSALSLPAQSQEEEGDHHHDDIVEHLDVIDPQVGTVGTLTNAANSILIPPLSWYSRKPVVMLSAPPPSGDEECAESVLEDSLDRHVEDVMKRRAMIKRTLRGVWSFLKTPMGVITAIYGFLVVFWGAAIVIFLAKIINFHNANTQGFWVEVSSQVENGLFTVTGIGLIPYRVLDTYRITKIWYYKRKTRRLRAKAGLPQLYDVDDLPDPAYDPNYVHVLTDEEQMDLHRQQVKFQYSQTWYRPHGTETHRAFPINTALLICCLNDGNSIFQCILCGTMWGLNRFERPPWSTGILIPASFLCGIISAVFIARGGSKTKRTKVVKEKLQAALNTEYNNTQNANGMNQSTLQSNGRTVTGDFVPQNEKEANHGPVLDDAAVIDEHMTVPQILADKEASS
ncbi:hypothetical protein K435DRAFT_11158 [Dendrothele bispora CBS 962.96]|uniref:Uncharacterized protein n=1 Tax=Dendrothele bispora (strain CBS 962.96) TaxID=1314807 RepID=A0A4S8MYD5_DENBC|nr:hypothetical protein K435DRAFT_11158 [Dendrothele bispora CBS 962.96]